MRCINHVVMRKSFNADISIKAYHCVNLYVLYVLLFIESKIPYLGKQLITINYDKEVISYFINPLE